MLSRFALLALAAAVALAPAIARADDAADARAEYAAGTAALAKSAYREAAEHFEIAARLRPHAAAFYAAGKAWQLAGELVKSADRLSAAVERNELSPADKGDALHRLVAIEERLGTVNVSGDASMELQIDDGPSVRPTGARHALPGKHTLFIRGAKGSATRDVSLNAGGSMSIELKPEMLVDKAVTPGPAPEPARPGPAPIVPKPDEVRAGGGSRLRVAGVVALVGAGVGAGVSIGLGVAALSARSKFLDSRSQTDFDSAIHLQTATNVGWAATAVLGAAGATLIIVSIVKKPESSTGLEIHPGGAAVIGRF